MFDPRAARTRYSLHAESVSYASNPYAEQAPFSPSSNINVASDAPCSQTIERPLLLRQNDEAAPSPACDNAPVCTSGALIRHHEIESDAQQRVKEATNKELTELDVACSLATHNSSLGQGKRTALWTAIHAEQHLRQVTTLLTDLEIQHGQTRHNWNSIETPKLILPSVEEITSIDAVKIQKLETKLLNLRTHIDKCKPSEHSDTEYLKGLLRHAGAQFEPLSAQWLQEPLKYALLPILQKSDAFELVRTILTAVATHMCAGKNLKAHATTLLEKYRSNVETKTLMTSYQALVDMAQLFRTRIFAWWPQGMDLHPHTVPLSQTMRQAIEQHFGESACNAFRDTFQSVLKKLNPVYANAYTHAPFHPLQSGDVFQLQNALKTIVQFCPWVKAAPYDYAYHFLVHQLEKYFENPRHSPSTPSSLFA